MDERGETRELIEAVQEFEDLLLEGRAPSIEEFAARHPGLAGKLRPLLEDVVAVRRPFLEAERGGPPPPPPPPPPPAAAPGGPDVAGAYREQLAPYEIVRPLYRVEGREVLEARHATLGRRVALKLVHKDLARALGILEEVRGRFEREGRILATIEHPGVVRVYDAGETENFFFIAMEFVEGAPLNKVIQRIRAVVHRGEEPPSKSPWRDTYTRWLEELRPQDWDVGHLVRVIRGVADALQHLHDHGVIHRDLKPSNLFCLPDGRVKIADFGISKLEGAETITRTGAVPGGTQYFESPEQARGKRVDHRSDIYSLGKALYAMLTLNLAPGRTGVWDPEELPTPRFRGREIAPDLRLVLDKAMALHPADRYASARELGEDLDRFLRRERVWARPLPAPRRALRFVRRHRAAAVAALLLAAVAIAAWSLFATRRLRARQISFYWKAGVSLLSRGEVSAAFITFGWALKDRSSLIDRTGGTGALRIRTEPEVPFDLAIRTVDEPAAPARSRGSGTPWKEWPEARGIEVDALPGCYSLELEATGYAPIRDCLLYVLPRNDDPCYAGFHERDVTFHLVPERILKERESEGMRYVPPGDFLMGSNDHGWDERPRRIVYLSGFFIDAHPVSCSAYARFIEDGGYERRAYWGFAPGVFDRHVAVDRPGCFVTTIIDDLRQNLRYGDAGDVYVPFERREEKARELGSWDEYLTYFYWSSDSREAAPVPVFFDCTGRPGPPFFRNGSLPPIFDEYPVVGVSLYEAAAFASWRRAQLPTMEQWEKAAAGPGGWPFPWPPSDGEKEDDPYYYVFCASTPGKEAFLEPLDTATMEAYGLHTLQVFGIPRSVSFRGVKFEALLTPYGCYHMHGNVWDWTRTRILDEGKSALAGEDPLEIEYVTKGGCFNLSINNARSQNIGLYAAGSRNPVIGFRCVRPAGGSENGSLLYRPRPKRPGP